MKSSPSLLEVLLDPITPEVFEREYRHKKVLVIPGGPEKVERLLGARFTHRDAAEVIKSVDQANRYSGYFDAYGPELGVSEYAIAPQFTLTKEQAFSIFLNRTGLTAVCRDFDRADRFWSSFVINIARELGSVDDVGISFHSHAFGTGTKWHFDCVEAFQLLTVGKRTWQVGSGSPIENCAWSSYQTISGKDLAFELGIDLRDQPAYQNVQNHELTEGDLIYVPEGVPHATTGNDDTASLGMTLSVFPVRRYRVIDRDLRVRLAQAGSTKNDATVRGKTTEARMRAARKILEPLNQLSQSPDVQTVGAAIARTCSMVKGGADSPVTGAIEQETRLTHDRRILLSACQTDTTCELFVGPDSSVAVIEENPQRFGFFTRLVETPAFVAGDAMNWTSPSMDWEETRDMLDALMSAGVLEVADDAVPFHQRSK